MDAFMSIFRYCTLLKIVAQHQPSVRCVKFSPTRIITRENETKPIHISISYIIIIAYQKIKLVRHCKSNTLTLSLGTKLA